MADDLIITIRIPATVAEGLRQEAQRIGKSAGVKISLAQTINKALRQWVSGKTSKA